jgi:hypothetical protein
MQLTRFLSIDLAAAMAKNNVDNDGGATNAANDDGGGGGGGGGGGSGCAIIEGFLQLHCGAAGLRANYATYASAVHGFGSRAALTAVRRQLMRRRDLSCKVPRDAKAPKTITK